MQTSLWFWVTFNLGVFLILALDLGVFHRRVHEVSLREATVSTAVFVALSLLFAALVWHVKGHAKGIEFLTGYVIEYSLSVDNIFVFVVIFSYFKVPPAYQHRVLFWGILTAIVMRGAMIAIGVSLIHRFEWIFYVFGIFLLATGIHMLFKREAEIHPENNPILKLFCRFMPVTDQYEGPRFLVRHQGRIMLTPLFLVFVVVNVTDVVFAVDSIPAIFGITVDPFIVYTSNICAILGLRSLYFLLAGVMNMFIYLQTGLALVLSFVGLKMVTDKWVHIGTLHSLLIIVTILGITIILSLLHARKPANPMPGT